MAYRYGGGGGIVFIEIFDLSGHFVRLNYPNLECLTSAKSGPYENKIIKRFRDLILKCI